MAMVVSIGLGFLFGNCTDSGLFIVWSILAFLFLCVFLFLKQSVWWGLFFGFWFGAGNYIGIIMGNAWYEPVVVGYFYSVLDNFDALDGYFRILEDSLESEYHYNATSAATAAFIWAIAVVIVLITCLLLRRAPASTPDTYEGAFATGETQDSGPRPSIWSRIFLQNKHPQGMEEPINIILGEELDTPLSVFEARAGAMCPVCRTDFTSGQEARTCPECGVEHHHECWAMIGGCSSFGCKHAPRNG